MKKSSLTVCLLALLFCESVTEAAVEVSTTAAAPGNEVRITSDDGRFAGYNNIGVSQMFNAGNSMWWTSVGEWVWSEDGRQVVFTVPSDVLPGTYDLSVFSYRRSVNEKFGTFTITGGLSHGALIEQVTVIPDPAIESLRITLKGSGFSKVRNDITLKRSPYDGKGYCSIVAASFDGETLEAFVDYKFPLGTYTISLFNGVMDGNVATVNVQQVQQVGTITTYLSEYDPNGSQTRKTGTKHYRFSGVKLIVGSAENGKFPKITFTQSGTATVDDLENVNIVARGKAYIPVIEDGKRYTGTFGDDIVTGKGFSEDVYIEGDLKLSSAGKTVEMDITDVQDIAYVGEVSGERLKIFAGQGAISPNIPSRFTGGSPWFRGSTLTIESLPGQSGGGGGNDNNSSTGPGTGGGGGGGGTPVRQEPPMVLDEVQMPKITKATYYTFGSSVFLHMEFEALIPPQLNYIRWSVIDGTFNVDANIEGGTLYTGSNSGKVLGMHIISLPESWREDSLNELRALLEQTPATLRFYRQHR